jgi:glycerate 2-kinase
MNMESKDIAKQIFLASVESVLPHRLISREMKINGDNLIIGPISLSLRNIKNTYVIGAGKASATMAEEVEKILGTRITDGHIVVKYGHACELKYITTTEAGHPVPDSNGYAATRAILDIAGKADIDDLVLCLISGGGSALLADFPACSSAEEMISLSKLLINSGASINEINTIRKHLSLVKGGQLARTVYPATLISLILSDVVGDPLDTIASGPTTPDPTTFKQALDILEKNNLTLSVPPGIFRYLNEGLKGTNPETPKEGDLSFARVNNLVVGSNRIAMEAGKQKAEELKINALIVDDRLQGDVETVARYIVETSLSIKNNINIRKPVSLLFGGEPTVRMTGNGAGGRNQHLALICSMLLQNTPGITILAAGTDGNDGPTEAAGAVIDGETLKNALLNGIDPEEYYSRFDSYNFFAKAGGHIITGPTRTNVMDVVVAVVE